MRPLKSGLLLYCLLLSALGAGAVEPVYVGYYRGPVMINSLGTVLTNGLFTFTNITDAAGSATRIGAAGFPSASWQKMAFDGVKYLTFVRSAAVQKGKGLYECDGNKGYTLISSNADSGVYTFTNWHGIGYCNSSYYGLYNGAGMSGPGLYRFTDPTDPENTAAHLFPSQTFPANIWNDVDFDGTRYLFAKTAAEGDPGIYQYDPQADSFTRISGAETYTNWDGLGVYVEPPPTPPSTNTPLLHKKIYVVLFGGQSNAAGWGYRQYLLESTNYPASPTNNPADFALAVPQSDVEMFSGVGLPEVIGVLTNLQSGTGMGSIRTNGTFQYPTQVTPPINRFASELSMARTVRDLIHIPNSKVVVIKYAASASSIYEDWRPDGTTNSTADGIQYRSFQTTVKSGLAAIQARYPDYEIEMLGMGWVQGESDALEGQATNYLANLTNFVADVRATFGTNIVFALSKLSPNQSGSANFATVREAQQTAADTGFKIAATETIGANYSTCTNFTEGGLHYLSPSLLQIGRDLGTAIVTASGLDSDDDGLPDAWENSYTPPGAAGLGNASGADYDGDGLTDLQEFQAGTNPTNSNDSLTLTKTASRVSWPAKKDVRYQMLASTNLMSWTDLGLPVLLRDSNSVFEVDFSPYITNSRAGYFRLQVR